MKRICTGPVPVDDNDKDRFMALAIEQGRKAQGTTHPNPAVGCVLVQDGKVIATGHTNRPGEDHAEAMALKGVSGDLQGVTCFVTLEPCSFQGRTPSCARELVARKIGHVCVGMLDPDPRNNGTGITILRDAGVTVEVGFLAEQLKADFADHNRRYDGSDGASFGAQMEY